ncbi:MAG: acyl-CoA thioesterase [Duncaniella sp.]|nr:acyl-CoA thioesterase [Duncaniella sp.]
MAHPAENIDLSLFHHRHPVQLRWNDLDMLGHVNNSIYFTFMDLAKTRYFQEALGEELQWGKIGVAIVNINCDFLAPTFFDDAVEVLTAITHIGEKSIHLEQIVIGVTDRRIRVRCSTVMAGFDMKTLKSAPIREEWRKAFEKFEGKSLS